MGHDQANVGNGAAHGTGQTGKERGSNIDDQADSRNVDTEMPGFFFTGKKQIQARSRSVNRAGSGEEPDSEKPITTLLKRGGEITHQTENHSTEIAGGHGAHEERDGGGKERASADTAETEDSAV